jgi:hypothetical protein
LKAKTLSNDEKDFIDKKREEGINDIVTITNLLYNREDLDMRSPEAKAVSIYLAQTHQTPKPEPGKPATILALTDDHKALIDNNIKSGLSVKKLTEIIFFNELQHKSATHIYITQEYRLVLRYIREKYPDYIPENESASDTVYRSPKRVGVVLEKVNKFCALELEQSKLGAQDRRCLEKLQTYLNSPRFIQIINSYNSNSDRDIFESEYIRSTWDKLDLTNDELNLYVNVCMDYVNLKQIESHKSKLNALLEDADEQADLTIKLAQMISAKSSEYHECSQRIEKTLAKLNGERSKRIQDQTSRNASLVGLVEEFQTEEGRKRMLKIANMQRQLVKEQAEKFETMSEFKARVLGISKYDAV